MWVCACIHMCLCVAFFYKSVPQWFSNFSMHQKCLKGLLKQRLLGPCPQFLIQQVCGGAWELAFVTTCICNSIPRWCWCYWPREHTLRTTTLPPWNSFPEFLRGWNEVIHIEFLAQGLAQSQRLLLPRPQPSWQLLLVPLLLLSCSYCLVILHFG